MTYKDAVTIMNGSDSVLTDLADKALGLGLVASALFAGPVSLALVGPKNELIKVGRKNLDKLGASLTGLKIADRSKRVQAAHAVLVMTSFLEACEETFSKPNYAALQLTEKELSTIFTGGLDQRDSDTGRLTNQLGDGPIPTPCPWETSKARVERVNDYYVTCAGRLHEFLKGLEAWKAIERKLGDQASDEFSHAIAATAAVIYENSCQRLAGDVPEFLYWSLNQEISAARAQLEEKLDDSVVASNQSLLALQQLLESVAAGIPAGPEARWLASLQAANVSELSRHLVDAGDQELDEMATPTVEHGYVNPNFRATPYDAHSSPAMEGWWQQQPLMQDLSSFLAAHLTSPLATEHPTLVLGHPGIGKSMMSRVLAARLPATGFMTIRVTLRNVAANASIETQIEESIFSIIHERISWPQLVEAAQNLLPVIILDGFDELLQATGTSQSDYLERVHRFMEAENSQGRPLAVIVTSRTTVVDRARIKIGTPIVKLEEFSVSQVERWLSAWNKVNSELFSAKNSKQLTWARLNDYGELAAQPVLLLMLALYDGYDNALENNQGLDRSSLYEALLRKFVTREILKSSPHLMQQEMAQYIEEELYDLSIISLGMFNRNKLVLQQDELDKDLAAIGRGHRKQSSQSSNFSSTLSPAEQAFGRFFFVHSSEAVEAFTNGTLQSGAVPLGRAFEFLHATFGEFLVARLAAILFGKLHLGTPSTNPWETQPTVTNSPLLSCLFSFQSFSNRLQVVIFLRELLAKSAPENINSVVSWLLANAEELQKNTQYPDYHPVYRSRISQIAHFSANVLILFSCSVSEFSISEIFSGERKDYVRTWSRWSSLWESQLDHEAWTQMTQLLILANAAKGSPSYSFSYSGSSNGYPGADIPALKMYNSSDLIAVMNRSNHVGNLTQEASLRLDWDLMRLVELLKVTESYIGDLSSSVYFFGLDESEFEQPTSIESTDGHYGATYFAALSFGDLDASAFAAHLSTVRSMLDFGPGESNGQSYWQLLRQLERGVHLVPADEVCRLLELPSIQRDDFPKLEINYLRLQILIKLWSLEGTQSMTRLGAQGLTEAAWAALDPVHLIDVAPERLISLLVEMYDANMPVGDICSEYTSFSDWVDRAGLVQLSHINSRLAYRVLRIAADNDLSQWAGGLAPTLERLDRDTISRLKSDHVLYFLRTIAKGKQAPAKNFSSKFATIWFESGGAQSDLEKAAAAVSPRV